MCTVVPLLRDHPVVHTKVVFEEGWSFIRGRKQCKPKHVSSGIVVLNVRWSLIRGSLKRGTTVYLLLVYNYNYYPARTFTSRGVCDRGWCPYICVYRVYIYAKVRFNFFSSSTNIYFSSNLYTSSITVHSRNALLNFGTFLGTDRRHWQTRPVESLQNSK